MQNSLVTVWCSPQAVRSFDAQQWLTLLQTGYAHAMLGRLHWWLEKHGVLENAPETVQWQLASARQLSDAHRQDTLIEVRHINKALKFGQIAPVFLKGAAYVLADDDAAHGRIFSDTDIFIMRSKLESAEALLTMNGWVADKLSEYDQAYYRKWMHELPPMGHKMRGTTLDLHHNLLPQTCRVKIDASKLDVSKVADGTVLSSVDRILHCVVHLMMDSEFEKGLRDLTDIALLVDQHLATDEKKWNEVIEKAQSLGVSRVFYLGIACARDLLNLQVPHDAWCKLSAKESRIYDRWGIAIWCRALAYPRSQHHKSSTRLAHLYLFLRGHWMKMPLNILLYHGVRKSWFNMKNIFTSNKT